MRDYRGHRDFGSSLLLGCTQQMHRLIAIMTIDTSTTVAIAHLDDVAINGSSASKSAGIVSLDYSAGPRVTCTKSREGYNLHNWKRRIAQGKNATTYFRASESSYSCLPSEQHVAGIVQAPPLSQATPYWRNSNGIWHHGIASIPALPPLGDQTKASNIAATKFTKKLESTMTAFQGGVFMGELMETLHMIRNPAKALRQRIEDYTQTLRKHRGRLMRTPSSNRLRFLSDTWLEYAFGWAPLLHDLDDARHVLDKRQNQLLQTLQPVHAVGRVQSTSFAPASQTTNSLNIFCTNRATFDTLQVYSGAVKSVADASNLIDSSAMGMSARNFFPTLWEVMPYSFMIDYFSNIGEVIQGWSNQTVSLAWGRDSKVRSTTYESTGVYFKTSLPVTWWNITIGGKTIARNKVVSRDAMLTAPVPSIQFELPGFGRKWINLSALATARNELRFR